MAVLFDIWFAGMRVFGRALHFFFFFVLMMAPFNMVAAYINSGDKSLFDADGLNLPAGMLLIALVIYMPFVAYFSARLSNQFNGAKTRQDNA